MKAFIITGALLAVILPPPAPKGGGHKKQRKGNGQDSREAVLARARAYMDAFPPAISGQDGHRTLFQLCLALVKGFSLSTDESFALVMGLYNPRCSEPWTEEEVRHKLTDAAGSTEVEDGYLLAAPGKRKNKRSRRRAELDDWSLRAKVSNAPLDLSIPGSWAFQEGGITRLDGGGDPSKNSIPKLTIPTGRVRDLDTGRRLLEVSWLTGTTWRSIVADRSAFKDRTSIVRLADQGLPVASHTASTMIQFLDELEVLNEELIPETVCTSHLGWHRVDGEMYFQVNAETTLSAGGSATFTFQPADQGDRQLAMAPAGAGSHQEWQRGSLLLMQFPKVAIAIHTPLASVLLEPLGHQVTSFSVSFEQRTSSGKTSAVLFGLSTFFRPTETGADSPLISFDATPVSLERRFAILHNLPAAIDDTKRAKNPQQVGDIPYLITQGIGRGRGTKSGLDRLRGWKLAAEITGEAPLGAYSQSGGAHARVLPIRGAPFVEVSEANAKLIAEVRGILAENYGHAGPAFVQRLLLEYKKDGCESLRKRHRDLAESYACRSSVGAIQRMATFAAAIHLAGELGHEWEILLGPFTAPMESVWKDILAEAEDPSGENRALLSVLDWARANPHRFQSYIGEATPEGPIPHQGWAGYWLFSAESKTVPDKLGFYPHVLDSVLVSLGYDPPAGILNGWRDLGYLKLGEQDSTDGKRRLAKNVSIKQGNRRLIVIDLSKVPSPDDKP